MELWPEGYYDATFKSGELEEANGKDRWVFKFEVNGTTKIVYGYYTGGAAAITEENLVRLGFNGDFENPQFSPPADIQIGCKHDIYEGKTKEQWSIGKAFASTPVAGDRLKRLSAEWRAKHGGQPKPPTTKPPTPAKPAAPAPKKAPPPPDDDEVESTFPAHFKAATKDEAWDQFVANNNGTADVAKWKAAVKKVSTKSNKREGEFGEIEWSSVVTEASLPF